MKNIAVIPLRSKSARFPGKNFTEILGRPLFCIAAKIAKESKVFDEVVIAIDSPDLVSDCCDSHGFKVFKRSKKSANAYAQTEDVLTEIIKSGKFKTKWLTVIQATCPFQNIEYFKTLEEQINKGRYNSIITRIKFKRFFIEQVLEDDFPRPRTQDIKSTYLETGLFWSFRCSHFLETKKRIIKPVGYIDIKKGDDLDIDYEDDLERAYPRLKNIILLDGNYTNEAGFPFF